MNYEDLPEEEALDKILAEINYLTGELTHIKNELMRLAEQVACMMEAETYRQGAISNDCSVPHGDLSEYGDLIDDEYPEMRFEE